MLLNILTQPWPWWISGPLIGLTVPLLLLAGNKAFGVSSSLRHICAACFPAKISFFNYNWKKEAWNLFFVAGILIGGIIAATFLNNHSPVNIDAGLSDNLATYGIHNTGGLVPADLFKWPALLTLRGIMMMVGGGFLVGFGTRYAGGCTSGHSIMGIANLQWPSLLATICFMLGGFIMTNFLLPSILKL